MQQSIKKEDGLFVTDNEESPVPKPKKLSIQTDIPLPSIEGMKTPEPTPGLTQGYEEDHASPEPKTSKQASPQKAAQNGMSSNGSSADERPVPQTPQPDTAVEVDDDVDANYELPEQDWEELERKFKADLQKMEQKEERLTAELDALADVCQILSAC
jgi:hypothetical protein